MASGGAEFQVTTMTKRLMNSSRPGRYQGLRGKVLESVGHDFEEGILNLYVRFVDKTELCWRITTRIIIEEADLCDWQSGDCRQLRVFVRDRRDGRT
jgi:hypothetical protein